MGGFAYVAKKHQASTKAHDRLATLHRHAHGASNGKDNIGSYRNRDAREGKKSVTLDVRCLGLCDHAQRACSEFAGVGETDRIFIGAGSRTAG